MEQMEHFLHPQNRNSQKLFWLLFLPLVAASRVPFFFNGFGSDEDAWRVARAAASIHRTGVYEASRFPGYPLYEYLSSLVIPFGGATLSNILTCCAGLAALFVWYRIVRRSNNWKILLVALAFSPLFWINSSITLEHVWSLLFLLLAVCFAERHRSLLAGLALGLSAGFRPTNLLALGPVLILVMDNAQHLRKGITTTAAALVVLLLAFFPVWSHYGVEHWLSLTGDQAARTSVHALDRIPLFLYRSVYAIGPAAMIVAASILFLHRKPIWNRFRLKEPRIVACAAGIILYGVLFFIFPLEGSYLLPATTFLFLFLDQVSSRRLLVLFTAGLLSFSFVNPDVVKHASPRGKPGINIHAGLVFQEFDMRAAQSRRRSEILEHEYAPSTVVMTGMEESLTFDQPLLARDAEEPWISLHEKSFHLVGREDVHFIQLLSSAEISRLQVQGYNITCLSFSSKYIEQQIGESLTDRAVTIIPLNE